MKQGIKKFQVNVRAVKPMYDKRDPLGEVCGFVNDIELNGDSQEELSEKINNVKKKFPGKDGWFVTPGAKQEWNPERGEYEYKEGIRGLATWVRNRLFG